MPHFREDGTFSFYNIPAGSYVLEVLNPTFTYEPLRVEINSKGKIRARKVNYIQASQVIQVNYPLKMKPLGLTRYFQVREQWRITDFLFNPMVTFNNIIFIILMICYPPSDRYVYVLCTAACFSVHQCFQS